MVTGHCSFTYYIKIDFNLSIDGWIGVYTTELITNMKSISTLKYWVGGGRPKRCE